MFKVNAKEARHIANNTNERCIFNLIQQAYMRGDYKISISQHFFNKSILNKLKKLKYKISIIKKSSTVTIHW